MDSRSQSEVTSSPREPARLRLSVSLSINLCFTFYLSAFLSIYLPISLSKSIFFFRFPYLEQNYFGFFLYLKESSFFFIFRKTIFSSFIRNIFFFIWSKKNKKKTSFTWSKTNCFLLSGAKLSFISSFYLEKLLSSALFPCLGPWPFPVT